MSDHAGFYLLYNINTIPVLYTKPSETAFACNRIIAGFEYFSQIFNPISPHVKTVLHTTTLLLLLLAATFAAEAQIGGNNTYEFLNLTNPARTAALGSGNFLAIKDNDIALTLANPSLITTEVSNRLAFSFTDTYTDIKYGFAMFGKDFGKVGSFVGSMQFADYGKFTYADATGVTAGEFTAGEYAFNIGWGRKLDSVFSIGANIKTIYSSLESYTSYGLAVDVAGSYSNKNGFTMSLAARNIGRQLTLYTSGDPEPLPFEVQFGMSKRLKHLPFRYSLILNHLEKWDLTYTDPNDNRVDPLTGEQLDGSSNGGFLDRAMRHVVLGGEFIPAKFLSIRIGYNYQRRQELKLTSLPSTVGFSWGIGLKISKFNFSYARARYHLAGSPNNITLTTNLNDFFKHN